MICFCKKYAILCKWTTDNLTNETARCFSIIQVQSFIIVGCNDNFLYSTTNYYPILLQ